MGDGDITMSDGVPWPDRVIAALASPPTVLWHATTPKKFARYEATGAILPPVRGFDSEQACREWARVVGRQVILRLDLTGLPVQALPDHHNGIGLAWWTPARVTVYTKEKSPR